MLALSLLMVFAALGVFAANVLLSGYGMVGPGVGQILYAPIPWWLLAALTAGAALGMGSLFRRRGPVRVLVVAAEVGVAAFLGFLLLSFTELPAHDLAVSVGDRFPSYSLEDQDGNSREYRAGAARKRALYVFYRGDW